MKFSLFRIFIGFLMFPCAYAAFLPNTKIVDLTHPFDKNTIYWPTEKGFEKKIVSYGMRPDNYFYSAFKFCAPEHGGTHVDAPKHFSEKGLTVDQIPPEQLIGNAVVIHVEKQSQANTDYAVSVADIKHFEKNYRPLTEQDIVLFVTGWGQYWSNKKRYMGSDKQPPPFPRNIKRSG